ncbi:hypothetical protein MLD38_021189 [Melastoma candidum]|uniref:Uncharacterized protein n=1 Tax=Melastoma candidum TaxID=119954 RepID=A0ACB9QJ58_9MYRT|nr:hypothetical protein MLD38_021189 [Melastoma candidum]
MAQCPSGAAKLFVLLMIVGSTAVACVDARKMLETRTMDLERWRNALVSSSLNPSLFLSTLPKGSMWVSSPSRKGHMAAIREELTARNLASLDRVLQSVPSPGIGH